MKTFIASSLVALTLVTGLVSTASAEPKLRHRAWWDQQTTTADRLTLKCRTARASQGAGRSLSGRPSESALRASAPAGLKACRKPVHEFAISLFRRVGTDDKADLP